MHRQQFDPVLAIYMTQILLLGVAGSALGVGLAAGVIAAVPALVGNLTELRKSSSA